MSILNVISTSLVVLSPQLYNIESLKAKQLTSTMIFCVAKFYHALSSPSPVSAMRYHCLDIMVFSDIDAELIISAVLGVTSHWAYFIHGEHHNSAPFLAQLYIVLVLAASLYQLHKHNYATLPALRGATAMTGVYVISLFTSMTIYRVFFHQLRSFPGPSFARVSKLWHAWKMRGLKNYLLMEKLNHKYGAFVRTGK